MVLNPSSRVLRQGILSHGMYWKSRPTCQLLKNALNGHRSINQATTSGPGYTPEQATILSAALSHVPTHGFTDSSLLMGVKDAGYLDITTNIFPQGPFDIVKYHLATQRERLVEFAASKEWKELQNSKQRFGTTDKIRALCIERLRQNKNIISHWPEAISLMKYPSNLQSSTSELFSLADTMWSIAGDFNLDVSWYTKRGILSGIYSATEVYMSQDKSEDFLNTWVFLDQRLADGRSLGTTIGRMGQYVDYAGHNIFNVLRSKGLKI